MDNNGFDFLKELQSFAEEIKKTIESAVNIIHREKYTFYKDGKGKLKYDYEQLIK